MPREASVVCFSKRYDLFGYEVKTATGPFIEKIQKFFFAMT
jgi:hypothetical protein